jgi:hypothetical protein
VRAKRTSVKATNPEALAHIVRQSRYFLAQMAEQELAGDTEKFRFHLSAFLFSFRTIAFRLYGITEVRLGEEAKRKLKARLEDHPELAFLFRRRNEEVHGDGPVVWQRIALSVADSISSMINASGPEEDVVGGRTVLIDGWQFDGNSRKVIELCHDNLNVLEKFVREVLAPNQR